MASGKPVLLLMDSPRKGDGGREPWTTDQTDDIPNAPTQKASLVPGAADIVRLMSAPPESLGRLLVDMTAQVQQERSRRSDVEIKNQKLLLEIEQLQKELLDLKTSQEQQIRRRASNEWELATRADTEALVPNDENAAFWWRELQEAKQAKDAAVADAHRQALEVLELQACISMQHDELTALRASEADIRFVLTQAEDQTKELHQQQTILVQENQLLKDEVAHLNNEIGKRGSHFKALMDKWSEAQGQCEHVERENRAMLDKMKDLRTKHEQLQREAEEARDACDVLQHQANHLKGAVAAKAAEAKAFQAYGTNAREHMQAQQAMLQRHVIYRRKVHHVARDSAVLVQSIKTTLASVRAPLVAIQHDFRAFLKHLQAPVMSLVTRSRRYAEVAHIEHAPLRAALADAELARRHLHEQLWRARRNALLVCQIRNLSVPPSGTTAADTILGEPSAQETTAKRTLRANYGTAELLLRESERDTVTVKCDAVFSDRGRGPSSWNNHESVIPFLQSVLDGFNACVTTFDGLPPLHQPDVAEPVGVPELMLTQLFALLHHGGVHFHRVNLTISFLGVYNEAIYDLLGLDPHATNTAATTAQSMSKIVVLEVENVEEALFVLRGGVENLDAAHEMNILDKFLTHKVITVCVAHDNLLLTGPGTSKSKLQIVELATGPHDTDATTDTNWEDRSRVKAHVAMENGVQALLTTLTDVRVVADGPSSAGALSTGALGTSFVRYHSSKLTVLLQDTVKASAKFLVLAALPGAMGTPFPPLDVRAAQATRWMFAIRNAVGSAASTSSSHGVTDRSVEGFINRFTSQQETNTTKNVTSFSSAELIERPALTTDVDPRRWEKDVDHMSRRYGDLTKFTTTFYQPSVPVPPESTSHRRRSLEVDDGVDAVSPRRPPPTVVSPEQLTDVVIRPDELVSIDSTDNTQQPPPVPIKTSRAKSKAGSKAYRGLPGHRNGSKSRALSASATIKSKRRVTTGSQDTIATTLAPQSTAQAKVTSIVKLRRETASSALRKALGSATASKTRAHAASATYHHASSLTSGAVTAVSTMTATSATQARLQNRKIPFK